MQNILNIKYLENKYVKNKMLYTRLSNILIKLFLNKENKNVR